MACQLASLSVPGPAPVRQPRHQCDQDHYAVSAEQAEDFARAGQPAAEPVDAGVLCHHRAMTTTAPTMMTASTPRAPTRAGRFAGRAGTGLAGGRSTGRDDAGRGA